MAEGNEYSQNQDGDLRSSYDEGVEGERKSPFGLWKGLGIDLTREEIDENRREMFGERFQ